MLKNGIIHKTYSKNHIIQTIRLHMKMFTLKHYQISINTIDYPINFHINLSVVISKLSGKYY